MTSRAILLAMLPVVVAALAVEALRRWFHRPRGNPATPRLRKYANADYRRRYRRMHRANHTNA